MLSNYIKVSKEQSAMLEKFYELHMNAGLNLTAIKDREEFYFKHYLDSIYIFILKNVLRETMADIGSGGGFPGIVTAIFHPEMKITLVESIAKKCRFLEHAASELGLNNVRVLNCRAEEVKGQFDLITARGVAKVREILKWTKHLARKDTLWLLYKGERLEEEMKQAEDLLKKYRLGFENVRVEEPFTRTYTIIGGCGSFADGILRGTPSDVGSR
ncbi:16S rRNA (guanine(527)-N(7))-methyltransferase RsmG [Geovibrio thiophilus]|uniref:Ribosomal RNA small subunit methyltransferase G n=1 Tax=Geovibrio thiophilus TaxID=139438 RepID=A0A410JVB5_9BACT|nr:16S rRNA (guanine(527)-N(7))-methyltransferase RsmG [Geovibrio thiophilus]QAR31969.1 16S rRNA (guanine(527)-N(7))-methyltransferase RsmG [Geovibrio thiophilus]